MSKVIFPKFNTSGRDEFFITLNKRVELYFKENKLSKKGGARMAFKTIVVLGLYFATHLTLILGGWQSVAMVLFLYALAGLAKSIVGLAVMHDANHGSLSKNKKINNFVSYTLNMIGGHNTNWKIQHNYLHHSFTNIHGVDEDIQTAAMLRFSPNEKRRWIHRFQFLYAWFFYGLMTLHWVVSKDIIQIIRYNKKGLLKAQRTNLTRELVIIVVSKILYIGYTVVLPFMMLDVSFWTILGGWLLMHFIAGLVLALIFQPAHVVPDTEFPKMDETGSVENKWAVHQLKTTMDFAKSSRLFSWFVGGLNFQVEHHLFPHICHVHYKKLSKIVESTCAEFKIPYYSEPTFVGALWEHAKLLHRFGRR